MTIQPCPRDTTELIIELARQQNRAVAMDAVGCMLVRDCEVVAVAGCDPEYKHDDRSAQGEIDIIAVREDTDWDDPTPK
jgi:hypothetical protein